MSKQIGWSITYANCANLVKLKYAQEYKFVNVLPPSIRPAGIYIITYPEMMLPFT